MLSKTLNTQILYIFIISLIMSCTKKGYPENFITIKVTSIDNKSKQHRINTFDTIEVRKEGVGCITKTYAKIGEYVTDSTGSVNIKIDRSGGYRFMLRRRGFYGSESFAEPFTKDKLKDGQDIYIEVVSLENR